MPWTQDLRAKNGGICEKGPTKICQNDKNGKQQKVLAVVRNKRTCTRRERRRRAKAYEQVASELKSSQATQRGGDKKKKKRWVRQRFGKTIRRQWRQKHRCQEQNRKIWQELHSTWLKIDTSEDQSMQPANEETSKSNVSPADLKQMTRSEAMKVCLLLQLQTSLVY